jgi:hypothetical protein
MQTERNMCMVYKEKQYCNAMLKLVKLRTRSSLLQWLCLLQAFHRLLSACNYSTTHWSAAISPELCCTQPTQLRTDQLKERNSAGNESIAYKHHSHVRLRAPAPVTSKET